MALVEGEKESVYDDLSLVCEGIISY